MQAPFMPLPNQASNERLGTGNEVGVFQIIQPVYPGIQQPQMQHQIQPAIQAQMAYQNMHHPAPTYVSVPAVPTGAADNRKERENVEHKKDVSITATDAAPSNALGTIVSLQEIAKPGFTDKISHQDLLATVKDLSGEMNCYVTLQNATVTGDIPISTNEFSTVGSTIASGLSSLFLRKKQATARKSLLNDINTAFEPGRLCLVIGAPSSGKSSLLKYISGRLDGNLDVEGKLRFNGIELAQKMVPRVSLYVPQTDSHTPVLTVEETLNFSFDCQSRKHATETLYTPAGIDLKSRPK
eukprot:3349912-Rhodomonas_salina.1